MWFVFDECGCMETFETEQEAKEHAESVLADACDAAADGWSDDSFNICWGKIHEKVKTTSSRPKTDDDDFAGDHIETIESRELVPV